MANYRALKDEIALPEYQSLTDDIAIAAAISAKRLAAPDRAVPISELVSYLRQRNLWIGIKSAQGSNAAAAVVVDLNEDPRAQSIDFSLPIVDQMKQALITGGLISQEDAAAMTALRTVTVSWCETVFGAPSVTNHDIEAARALEDDGSN